MGERECGLWPTTGRMDMRPVDLKNKSHQREKL